MRMKLGHVVVRLRSGAGARRWCRRICQPFDHNHMPEIGQSTHNPVIAPVPVLPGHANDQLLDLAPDPRSAWTATGLRAIELAGDKLAVPSQDGVRPRYSCDLGEGVTAQAMSDLAERGSLGVREFQPSFQLGF